MNYRLNKYFILYPLSFILSIAGYIGWAANGGLVREGNWVGVDFHVYYQAARVLSKGQDVYSAGIAPPYVYPPLLAILVLPLSFLSVTTATILWKLLQHLCLLAAGWLLVRLLPAAVRPLAVGILFLGLLTIPLQSEIQVGESNSLVLLLTVGALYIVARKRGIPGNNQHTPDDPATKSAIRNPQSAIAAGVMLALAVSIKVLPALLVAYFWWRGPRRVAAVATAGFVALQLLSQAVTPSTAHYWLNVFPDLFGQAFPFLENQSLNAAISRALLPTDPSLPNIQIADGEALRPAFTWIANLLVLGAAIWVLWAARKRAPHVEGELQTVRLLLEASLVLMTTHLVSGSTWLHHLVALSVPVTALLGAWWLHRREGIHRGNLPTMLALILLIGLGATILLHSPQDWLLAASTFAPQNALIALIASSAAMLVVMGMWVAVAATLLRSSKFKVQRGLSTLNFELQGRAPPCGAPVGLIGSRSHRAWGGWLLSRRSYRRRGGARPIRAPSPGGGLPIRGRSRLRCRCNLLS